MNKELLTQAGIDVNDGIRRFNDKEDLYERFLFTFPKDVNYDIMCEAISKGDAEQAFQAANALKGITGNLSLNQLLDKTLEMNVFALYPFLNGSSPLRALFSKLAMQLLISSLDFFAY